MQQWIKFTTPLASWWSDGVLVLPRRCAPLCRYRGRIYESADCSRAGIFAMRNFSVGFLEQIVLGTRMVWVSRRTGSISGIEPTLMTSAIISRKLDYTEFAMYRCTKPPTHSAGGGY